MIKICCITYGEQTTRVKREVQKLKDDEICIYFVEGLREKIIEPVKKVIAEGVEVLISGGANAEIAREQFNCPVLNYKISDFDYVTIIKEALKQGDKLAIVTYKHGIAKKLLQYISSQNLDVENIIYEDTEELDELIRQSKATVIIGAAHATEIAKRADKKTVFVSPGEESILETINDAKNLANEVRKMKEKNQYSKVLMEYSPNGFIFMDGAYHIVDYNKHAKRILELQNQHIKGKYIGDLLDIWDDNKYIQNPSTEIVDIVKVNQQMIQMTFVKIKTNSFEFQGSVLIVSVYDQRKQLQMDHWEKERKARKEQGFSAKKEFYDIIGESYLVKSVIEDAKFFAKSDASVLLYGETGVGKEIFAQSIHNSSNRRDKPFIAVNCGALPENLLETELFGYDEGAFTGGKKGGKKGLFELAESGTLFLDEIGEITPLMQTRLLRVLQEHEIMHVGGDKIISVDVRIISATNKDLENQSAKEFRRDLLYRLNVLELHIPPLRDRDEDVVVLFDYFYRQRRCMNIYYVDLIEEVKEIIRVYKWPGNIREMQNVCERYCLYLEQAIEITHNHMRRCMIKAIGESRMIKAILEKYEYDGKKIETNLVYAMRDILQYNREQIANVLGSSRTTIWRILKEKVDEQIK